MLYKKVAWHRQVLENMVVKVVLEQWNRQILYQILTGILSKLIFIMFMFAIHALDFIFYSLKDLIILDFILHLRETYNFCQPPF